MQLTNSKTAYGWVAIVLHWVVALGAITMFVVGLQADAAGQAGDRAARGALMGVHIGLGALLFGIIAFRVFWSLTQPKPEILNDAPPLRVLARVTHGAMLLGLAVLIVSGPLTVWSGGREIDVFGLVTFGSPFATANEGLHEIGEIAHAIGRALLFFGIILHLGGVAKHVFVDADDTLQRMVWVKRAD